MADIILEMFKDNLENALAFGTAEERTVQMLVLTKTIPNAMDKLESTSYPREKLLQLTLEMIQECTEHAFEASEEKQAEVIRPVFDALTDMLDSL